MAKRKAGTKKAKQATDGQNGGVVALTKELFQAAITLAVGGITTVEAQRTFWDKVVILHGLRRWYDHRGQLRHGGQRVSRHYYDVFRLLQSPTGEASEADRPLGDLTCSHVSVSVGLSVHRRCVRTVSHAPRNPGQTRSFTGTRRCTSMFAGSR